MQLDKALDTAFEILDKDTLDEEMIQLYGAQAPVNPIALKNVDKEHIVCIGEKLLEVLYEMHVYTNLTNNECAFFLFGEEREDGSIYLDKIVYEKGKSRHCANFSSLTPKLSEFINEVEKENENKKVVAHCHTHGAGVYSDNFSLGDIASYIIMSDLHPLIRQGVIQTLGCIFNSSGDINFVFYDKKNNEIYKFPNVCVEYDNGERTVIPAYLKGSYVTSRHGR